MSTKPLINIHIPKTAGRSLNRIIFETLEDDKVFKLGTYKRDPITNENIINTLEDFERLSIEDISSFNYITGHFPFGIDKKLDSNGFSMITCLRNPIERVFSFLNYQDRNNNKNEQFLNFESQNGIVKRFCGYYYDKDKDKVFNYLTNKYIDNPNFEVNEDDLITAIDNLNKFSLIMFQENFTESLILLEQIVEKKPLISFENQFRNTFKKDSNWSDACDQDSINKIFEDNKYDIILYNYFKEKFNEIITSQNDNFKRRVGLFGILNSILKPPVGETTLSYEVFVSRFNNLTVQFINDKNFHTLYDLLNIVIEKYPENSEFLRVKDLIADKIKKIYN